MEDWVRYLIIITLAYYLVKGLLYLLLWKATYVVQEKSLAQKLKRKKQRQAENEARRSKHKE